MAHWLNKRVPASADGQDADRAKDWLTALSPVFLMMVVNYHWPAVLAVLTAAAGFAAVTVLWQWLNLTACRVAPALVCGVVVACCLPDSAPLWLSALAGLIGGILAVVPALIHHFFEKVEISCPVYFAPLAGYLAVRWIFPSYFTAFSVPLMWMSADAVATATPLTSLGNPDGAVALSHLFWGFDAGSMGGGPAPALLLGCIYLFLRRRINPIPVAAMGGTVVLLSWACWNMPLYSLLAGGVLLSALLLGDEGFVHVGWKGRLAAGVTAGAVTVLCRLIWGVDGSAVGVLAAGVLTPVLHVSYHGLCRLVVFLREKFAKTEN